MALVKYNNNSISAVTSAASIPSGAMTLIKTLTASSSATLSFVHGTDGVVLDSTYPIYKFSVINFHPSTHNGRLEINFSTDSGSNYNTTLTSTFFYAYHFENDSAAVLAYDANMDQAQGTAFQRIIDAIGNLADESGSGTLYLFNPSSTTFVKHYMSNCNSYVDGTFSTNYFSAGYYNTTSAIDAVQFKMSSGNMDAGTIKLYGIKDS